MSHVTCHCHVSHVFLKKGEAGLWSVFYQRGLSCLVYYLIFCFPNNPDSPPPHPGSSFPLYLSYLLTFKLASKSPPYFTVHLLTSVSTIHCSKMRNWTGLWPQICREGRFRVTDYSCSAAICRAPFPFPKLKESPTFSSPRFGQFL